MNIKRNATTFIAIISIVTLVGTGMVNASMVSGYTAFKEGVKETIGIRNATVSAEITINIDGMEYAKELVAAQIDISDNGMKAKYENSNYHRGESSYTNTSYEDSDYYYYGNRDGNFNAYKKSEGSSTSNKLIDLQDEIIDLAETLTDSFIGNAREYFNKTKVEDGYIIDASFDRTQVPTIANSFMDFFVAASVSQAKEYGSHFSNDEPVDKIMNNPNLKSGYINLVTLDSKIGDDGMFEYVYAKGEAVFITIDGEEIPFSCEFKFDITNKGTTVVEMPEADIVEFYENNAITYEANEEDIVLIDEAFENMYMLNDMIYGYSYRYDDSLDYTDEQKDKFKDIVADFNAEMQAFKEKIGISNSKKEEELLDQKVIDEFELLLTEKTTEIETEKATETTEEVEDTTVSETETETETEIAAQ